MHDSSISWPNCQVKITDQKVKASGLNIFGQIQKDMQIKDTNKEQIGRINVIQLHVVRLQFLNCFDLYLFLVL